MNIEIIQLRNNSYLVLGETVASITAANTVDDLAKELNKIAKNAGVPHDIYICAIDKQKDSPSYGKQILLALLPQGNYTRVLVSN